MTTGPRGGGFATLPWQAVFRNDLLQGHLSSDASEANPFVKHDIFSNTAVVNPNQIFMLYDQVSKYKLFYHHIRFRLIRFKFANKDVEACKCSYKACPQVP